MGRGAGQELSYLPVRPPWLHLVERGGKREKGKKNQNRGKRKRKRAERTDRVPLPACSSGECQRGGGKGWRLSHVPTSLRVAPCRDAAGGLSSLHPQRCALVAPRGRVGGIAGWGRRVGSTELRGRRVGNNGSGIRSAAFFWRASGFLHPTAVFRPLAAPTEGLCAAAAAPSPLIKGPGKAKQSEPRVLKGVFMRLNSGNVPRRGGRTKSPERSESPQHRHP